MAAILPWETASLYQCQTVRRPGGLGGTVRRLRGLLAAAALALVAFAPLSGPARAANTADVSFLRPIGDIAAPRGFAPVCARYAWACAGGARAQMNEADLMKVARMVNSAINRSIHQIADDRQYGVDEVWALPTRRGGDCEDLVLLKKLALIKKGVPASRLLIATVIDRRKQPHAVLVLRTASGDLVLDNLRSQIRPWQKTGYTFLRMQDPDAPQVWKAVFAGGIFGADRL